MSSIRLSASEISSYAGNVLPLQLLSSEEDLTRAPISWRIDGDAVELRSFASDPETPFTNGVLLTLMRAGEATVTATLRGRDYPCRVSVRPLRHRESGEKMQYFIGDLHDHTTKEHNHVRFRERSENFPMDMIETMKRDGRLDFAVVSDHACTCNPRDFFRGFTDDLLTEPKDLIVFPGTESEITLLEEDRYGVMHKNSGEIVTLNADNMASVTDWEAFFEALSHSPFAFCTLAHPQIIGIARKGIWNFSLDRHRSPRHRELIRLVEMGDGGDRQSNLINEYVYSVALDNGFRVSPTCSSDSHGPEYGYDRFPGKTVLMAPEKTKEAFYDAILSNRVYACMSGNVKLSYSVNGIPAPATLPLSEDYRFCGSISYFHEDPSTRPVRFQIISNRGRALYEGKVECDCFDVTISAPEAAYFYLRLWDEQGRKTWSCPVFTGRTLREEKPPLSPIDKSRFTALDETDGADASVLFCDDPTKEFTSSGTTVSILLDMKREYELVAFGHYARMLEQKKIRAEGLLPADKLCELPSAYRLSLSCDAERFQTVSEGLFRTFGGEEILYFPACRARFVRLEILSSVGLASQRPAFAEARIVMAELTPYEKAKE